MKWKESDTWFLFLKNTIVSSVNCHFISGEEFVCLNNLRSYVVTMEIAPGRASEGRLVQSDRLDMPSTHGA